MAKDQNSKFLSPYEAHAMGGRATHAKRTPEERSAFARRAVAVRWAKARERQKVAA